jgi:hypothetical protein
MSFPITVFMKPNFAGTYAAEIWANVGKFADYYELTDYFFESASKGVGSCHYNSSVVLQLLINKCNAMQAQIDALGTIDMDAIINAMLKATFDQLQYFIGLEDAYRVALWNAPFNADFYAALARGFQKWP